MLDLSNVWPEWQAVELLGEGSFGKVYRCVREEYGMKFESAVKVISLPSSRAEVDSFFAEGMSEEQIKTFYAEIVEDFASEIKMLFLLKGAPNIVAVENYKIVERKNEIGWDIYILMEYLESFAKYSHGKNLTEADIKALALDMCTALKSCGKYNVIHRDIKPGNIFIDRFGSFKLGDFSIARQLEGTMDFMSKKGTFGYMAPEVFRGESYDFRVDIYSLGRVLYKLLNRNKEPFIDVNKEFVSFKDRNESLERIRKGEKLPAPVDASPAMAAVILKACEYNASDRFASVEEFRAALESVPAVTEEPTVAAQDYFEKTVAAREIELPAPVPVEADCDDETVVIAPVSEEATELLEAEETAILPDEDETVLAPADPDATMLADADYDEPTVMAEKDELPTNKESKNKKKKIIIFSILGIVAVAAIVLGILFGKGVLGSSNQNPPPAESEAQEEYYDDSYYEDYYEEPYYETLYREAEEALASGDKANAAILFGKSANYGYFDARERSFALWDEVADKQTFVCSGYDLKYIDFRNDLCAFSPRGLTSDWGILFENIVDVSNGEGFSLALSSDGTVFASGDNDFGQCDVSEWKNIVSVSAGSSHSVGLKTDGTVVAVGHNGYSGCDVDGWSDIVAVSAANTGEYSVGLKSNGSVVYAAEPHNFECPYSFSGISDLSDWKNIVDISAGGQLCVGIKDDGTAELAIIESCDGGLYHDGNEYSVDSWTDIIDVSAGGYHAVGLRADGTVVAVGGNDFGQCDVENWTDIIAISSDYENTYGLKSDGTVVATGICFDGTEILATGIEGVRY